MLLYKSYHGEGVSSRVHMDSKELLRQVYGKFRNISRGLKTPHFSAKFLIPKTRDSREAQNLGL
jgi:hypothetical protein